ncbi:MAG: hypothetical protein Q4C87_08485 [Actinomycetaceae bacterium]|nr:hypothetical protein [Actinomycetaceae bacterium]
MTVLAPPSSMEKWGGIPAGKLPEQAHRELPPPTQPTKWTPPPHST